MRHLKMLLAAVVLLLSLHAGAQSGIKVERDVSVTMRDGVTLSADIYRPLAPGKYPVLLQRTPYDKNKEASLAVRATQQGFVVIVQDVRGRYASKGEWYPFRDEAADGYDTVEWAAKLPYSDGRVGMYGSSYVGATQMLAAMAHPPHLAGICPMFTPSNYYSDWVYQGGAFEQWFNESWTSILARNTIDRYLTSATNPMPVAKNLPLAEYPLFNLDKNAVSGDWTQAYAPYFKDWLAHPSFDDYWKRWSIEDHFADIHVPALTVGAWYDIFLGGSLRNYAGMHSTQASSAERSKQYLLITVGGHAGSGRKIGDMDFGPAAEDFDEDNVTLEWYNYLFHGTQGSFALTSPVLFFLMGTNRWQDATAWPPANAHVTKYFLHSSGKANSAAGDGTLSTVMPAHEGIDAYTYDPQNPIPTVGGPLCCDGHVPSGPRNQQMVEQRSDVLVYSTPPLQSNLTVAGPVSVELYAKSSAADTDFTAKLVDVGPDGYARNLTEGIVRARYRDSVATPKNLTSGKIYKFSIDLWATGNVFLPGHRLRLEVSSSNFPRFDRNLNTGKGQAHAINWANATNAIYHDADHPSALILSVMQ